MLAKALQQSTTQTSAIGVAADEFAARTDRFIKAVAHGAEIAREAGHIKAATLSWTEGKAAIAETMAALGEYADLVKKVMANSAAQAAQDANAAELILAATMLASLLIAIGSASWVSLTIGRGLSKAVGLAGAVAAGDLTQTIALKGNDEICDVVNALRDMCGKLRAIITETNGAIQNLSSGSQELSASAEQLSQGATEQAAAAEEASSSMEEMASNVKQNADNASQTEKIARQSSLDAEASGAAVIRAVNGDGDDRREDHHRPGNRPPDRPAGAQCGGRSGAGRRARPWFCCRRVRSSQARRTQPGRRGRNRRAVVGNGEVGAGGGHDARQAGARTSNKPPNWLKRSPPPAANRMSARTRSTRLSSSSTK